MSITSNHISFSCFFSDYKYYVTAVTMVNGEEKKVSTQEQTVAVGNVAPTSGMTNSIFGL